MASQVAVILAGGHGECLRRGDAYIPKLLLPIGSKPLLERQIEWLKSCGFEAIVLCLGFKAAQVRGVFGDGARWGVKLRYSVDEHPLGAAGAVKALGPASLPENVLVLDGGVYGGADCRKLYAEHLASGALATLAVRPAGKAAADLVVLGPSRLIVDFPVSSSAPGRAALAAAPLWVIRRPLFHYVPDDRPSDFLKDVFPAALRAGETLAAHLVAGVLAEAGANAR